MSFGLEKSTKWKRRDKSESKNKLKKVQRAENKKEKSTKKEVKVKICIFNRDKSLAKVLVSGAFCLSKGGQKG